MVPFFYKRAWHSCDCYTSYCRVAIPRKTVILDCLLLNDGPSHNVLCLQLGDDVEEPVEEELIEEVAPTELVEAPDLLSFDDEEETTVVRATLVDALL